MQKKQKKITEELIAHVRAMVDADARVSLQEIAVLALIRHQYQGSSMRNLATGKCLQDGSLMFRCLNTRRIC